MKKFVTFYLIAAFLTVSPTPAFALFGGGFSGPMPVYSVDKTVDAATLATQVNTAKQLQAALQNLATMDPATAAANAGQIQQTLQHLIALQQEIQGIVYDYQNFQQQWDSLYQTNAGEGYANQAAQVLQATDQAVYNAMRSQGFAVSQTPSTVANLNGLLNASQSAQGALAAAQAGNQIAAMQANQLLLLQQMIASNNQAQLAYQKQREQQERDAEQAAAQQYSEKVTPQRGQGPGFGGW